MRYSKTTQWIGKFIWDFTGFYHIPLGRFAPIVFGWMIGSPGKRVDTKEAPDDSDDGNTNKGTVK